jgi:hypothetical protein
MKKDFLVLNLDPMPNETMRAKVESEIREEYPEGIIGVSGGISPGRGLIWYDADVIDRDRLDGSCLGRGWRG